MINLCWRTLLVSLFVMATPAHASVVWTFEITNPVQTVLPSETITFNATIRNAPESTESLIIGTPCSLCIYSVVSLITAQGDFTSDLFFFDEGNLGPDTLVDSLAGSIIPVGESLSFTLYSRIPVAPVPAGIYRAEFNSFYINGYGGFVEGGPVQATVVPLPGGLVLLVSGMVAMGLTLRSTRTRA